MRYKKLTYTFLVAEALRRADDFRTLRQLMADTNQPGTRGSCRISAALSHLKKMRVVDCLASEGQLWWFLLPPAEDRRSTHVDMWAEEPPGSRKPRRSRRTPK